MFSVVFIIFVCLGLRGYLFLLQIGRGDFRTYSFMKMFCLQHDCKVFFIIWFFDFFFFLQLNEVRDNNSFLLLMRYGTLDDDQTDEFQPGCKVKEVVMSATVRQM